MAGKPKTRALHARLDKEGGIAALMERVAAGGKDNTISAISRSEGVSRQLIYEYIKLHDPDHKLFNQAKKQSAEGFAEEGLEILDGADGSDENNARVTAAKNRAEYRKWMASMRDGEQFGKALNQGTVVNIQNLHLDALRAHGGPIEKVPEAEYEVVEDPKQLAEEFI